MVLVSERADAALRQGVRLGNRPRPEYLLLEEQHGLTLLDWSQLGDGANRRSGRGSLAHVAAALNRLDKYDGVLSDGEHVGVPLALAMLAPGRSRPHVVICHHLTSRSKPLLFRTLQPHRRMSRLLLHSRRQVELAVRDLRIPPSRLHFQPYGVDHLFWSPRVRREEALIVSAGREHRDYETLARAVEGVEVTAFLATGSLHNPGARHAEGGRWPENVSAAFADHRTLREWYARAALVVVPLIPNDFQAGVTTLLEAMSMGKAVVVTATEGQRDVVEHGVSGLTVPPGDAMALREAITSLLASPRDRRRLGANARAAVESRFTIDRYASSLARHMDSAMSSGRRGTAPGINGPPSGSTAPPSPSHETATAVHVVDRPPGPKAR